MPSQVTKKSTRIEGNNQTTRTVNSKMIVIMVYSIRELVVSTNKLIKSQGETAAVCTDK